MITPTAPQEGWPIKYVEVFESAGEIAIAKRWEEKTPAERFPEMFGRIKAAFSPDKDQNADDDFSIDDIEFIDDSEDNE